MPISAKPRDNLPCRKATTVVSMYEKTMAEEQTQKAEKMQPETVKFLSLGGGEVQLH